ncbi:MAG TPA: type II toxin-antitoxin system VapB family antitoxin [Verrucomicrobiales bacterium]|jgi:Arc/MetJ family transcription regulator|nr:type II toxin-antitoxin system VapB family antitoxin [Verrucomicrobiales bacterium]
MKMTMHIDDDLLERVINATGAASKTEAVSIALKEMDRKARLREYTRKGLGLSRAELMEAIDPAYDLMALRVAEDNVPYSGAAAAARKAVDYRKVISKKRKR